PGGQAALRGFERWKAAAFLLDQIILHSAYAFSGFEDPGPWRIALGKKNAVAFAFAGRPILAVQAVDAAGIRPDPGNRVRAGLHAGADVELQHHVLRRIGGEHFHGTGSVQRSALELVTVGAR